MELASIGGLVAVGLIIWLYVSLEDSREKNKALEGELRRRSQDEESATPPAIDPRQWKVYYDSGIHECVLCPMEQLHGKWFTTKAYGSRELDDPCPTVSEAIAQYKKAVIETAYADRISPEELLRRLASADRLRENQSEEWE